MTIVTDEGVGECVDPREMGSTLGRGMGGGAWPT
jgi:hypothetical protein